MGGPPMPLQFGSKEEMYAAVTAQVRSLTESSNSAVPHATSLTTHLANVSSVLFYALNAVADPQAVLQQLPVNWVGFYLLINPQLLVLGPFQGKVACTEIKVGKGVCGAAVLAGKSQLVDDVHNFPGHIACDSESVAEVVIPIRNKERRIVGVLDIDSTRRGHFSAVDVAALEEICQVLGEQLHFASSVMALSQPRGAPDHPSTIQTAIITPTGDVAVGPTLPSTTVKRIAEWELKVTELDRMMSQARVSEVEKLCGVAALPEIVFEHNTVAFRHMPSGITFNVGALDALRDAAQFYHTPAYAGVKEDISVPTANLWRDRGAKVFDAGIDWAFRNTYGGIWASSKGAATVKPSQREIDMNMLRDTSLQILFYNSMIVFEDDLHDFGLSRLSLKFRVMEPCFFVLVRHFVRIDRVSAQARETRVFHRFGEKHVVLETTLKRIDCSTAKDVDIQCPEDEICAKMETLTKVLEEVELQ